MPHSRIIFLLVFLFILTACEPATAIPTLASTPVPSPTSSPFTFAPHTADDAQELLTQAEEAVYVESYADFSSAYYLAAEYAAWEALHRFPNDPRVETWKWKFPYYAALSGDTDLANDSYMDLISNALNEENIAAENLLSWFQSGELKEEISLSPVFFFEVEKVDKNKEGEKYVIQLGSNVFHQGSCYLVMKEEGVYSTYLIHNGFLKNGHSIGRYDSITCDLKDLTNDGFEEIIVKSYYGAHAGYSTTQVFDVSSLPISPLPFRNSDDKDRFIQYEYAREYPYKNEKRQIVFFDSRFNCPIWIYKSFEWDGTHFVLENAELDIEVSEYASLQRCWTSVVSAARRSDIANGIEFLDEAIQIYLPHALTDYDKQLLDNLQIEKGLLYLFNKEPEKVRQIFQDFLKKSYQENSIWAKPVQNFLNTYHSQDDIYRACSVLTPCNPYSTEIANSNLSCIENIPCATDALKYLIGEKYSTEPINNLAENLEESGVEMAYSEYIDFNEDGINEFLFSTASREKDIYSIWVVAKYQNSIKFDKVATPSNPVPEFEIVKIGTETNVIFVNFDVGGGLYWSETSSDEEVEPVFAFNTPVDSEHLDEYWNYITNEKQTNEIRYQLLSEKSFEEVYTHYLDIANQYAKCAFEPEEVLGCALYYYDTAFAAELAGDEKIAREMYSNLIEQYPEHPLALLAYNKLE